MARQRRRSARSGAAPTTPTAPPPQVYREISNREFREFVDRDRPLLVGNANAHPNQHPECCVVFATSEMTELFRNTWSNSPMTAAYMVGSSLYRALRFWVKNRYVQLFPGTKISDVRCYVRDNQKEQEIVEYYGNCPIRRSH